MQPRDLRAILTSHELATAVADLVESRGEPRPERIDVDYVRFKPGVACLLGLGTGSGPSDLGYLRLLDGDGAETCRRKYAPRARGDAWVELVPGFPAVFFRSPGDRHVTGLASVVDPARVKHLLHECVPGFGPGEERIRGRKTSCRVLRYKPERRAVVRVDAGTRDDRTEENRTHVLVARAYADDGAGEVFTHLRQLSRVGIPVPPPVAHHTGRRALVTEWTDGRCLAEILGSEEAPLAAEEAGTILARLRGIAIRRGPVRDASRLVEEARIVLDDLGRVTEGPVAAAATLLAFRLSERSWSVATTRPSILHGDFHHRQVLVTEDGVRLLDWDEAAVGDPREDAANFLAHLELLTLEGRLYPGRARILEERFLAGTGLPHESVSELVAPQLAKLATVPFRNLRDRWEEETLAILERALAYTATTVRAPS